MYPATDVVMTNTTCANSVCKSDNPARGGKNKVNLWAAGDNLRDEVYTSNLKILDSHYYKPCSSEDGRISWEARSGLFTVFEVSELSSWTPKNEL